MRAVVGVPGHNSNHDELEHRKRLVAILRYIASMHQSSSVGEGIFSFVRAAPAKASDFFQREGAAATEGGVLFSMNDFRQLMVMEQQQQQQQQQAMTNVPSGVGNNIRATIGAFSFYAAAASTAAAAASTKKKRTLVDAIQESICLPSKKHDKVCWLRITRLTATQLGPPAFVDYEQLSMGVRTYLDDWLGITDGTTLDRILTLRHVERAPKPAPSLNASSKHEIKVFLRKQKRYLTKRMYQSQLEPIYNQLFEWIQLTDHQSHADRWGVGQRSIATSSCGSGTGSGWSLAGPAAGPCRCRAQSNSLCGHFK
jgi:hypothetical protein